MTGAPRAGADDADQIAGAEPALRQPVAEPGEAFGRIGCLQLGQCAQRETERETSPGDGRRHLAAMGIGHPGTSLRPP